MYQLKFTKYIWQNICVKEKRNWAVCLWCISSARELSTFQLQLITIILSYFYSLSAEKKNLHSQHFAVVEQ